MRQFPVDRRVHSPLLVSCSDFIRGSAFVFTLSALTLLGCEEKESAKAPTPPASSAEKQARLDALLKENGLDPNTLPTAAAPGATDPAQAQQPSAASPAQPTPPAAQTTAPNAQPSGAQPGGPNAQAASAPGQPGSPPAVIIKLLTAGSGPKQQLRYGFTKGSQQKFALDIEVGVERLVNGQPTPGMPPFALSLKGATITLSADASAARRQHTFIEMIPAVTGVPPEVVEQIKAQYSMLNGLQLIETVSPRGIMMGMELDQRAVHPQVLALMQHLQDGMTNAFLPLPEESVGVGARWVGTTTIDAAGIRLIQENEIQLNSLEGSVAEVGLKLKQTAQSSKIEGANLPPGVTINLTKLEGKGAGSMKVDFKNVLVTSKVELSTTMETTITQPETPAPIKETAKTSMKAQIAITN